MSKQPRQSGSAAQQSADLNLKEVFTYLLEGEYCLLNKFEDSI
jgi:hypothetical protein